MPDLTTQLLLADLDDCEYRLDNARRAGNPNAIDDLLDEEARLRDLLGLTRRR